MIELNQEEQKINEINNNEMNPCHICGTPAPYRQLLHNPQNFMPICDSCREKQILEYQREVMAKTQVQQEESEDFVLEESETQKPLNLFSQGWHLEIEETQAFKDRNIVVLVNAKGKHLFMKAVKMLNGFIELAPITKQEAEENKINFEESLNEQYFEMDDIEESQSELENAKVTHKFNSQDPESMRKAAQTALEISNRLSGKNAKIQESTEPENEDLETVKSERDTYKGMLDLVAQKEFEKKKAQLNAPENITTVEELKAFSEGKKSATVKPIPSGTIPWDSQQSSSEPQVFDSQEALIDNIRDRASAANKNPQDRAYAQKVLEEMMRKAFSGQKDCNKPFDYTMPKDVSINDILNAKYQRRKKLAKGV